MAQKTFYCDPSDLEQKIEKVKQVLSPQSVHAAMSSALNRTLTFVSAETKRQVQAEYAVTKSIDKSVKKTKATSRRLIAEAAYTDKPIPMFVFKHKVPANQYRSPVSVLIKKSNGMRTHEGSNPALFKAYGGKKIIRRDAGQKNLHTAYTVSIPQMVANDKVYEVIAKKAEDKLSERFEHELDWRMSKI